VFRNLSAPGMGGVVMKPTAAEQTLSDQIHHYWVNFAATGDPNGPGLPPWPAFDVKTQQAMVLDDSPVARPLPNQAQLHALDDYFRWRRESQGK
jgi:para-nitrobenzyl esterase